MHSIELLLDPATDGSVRSDWNALALAGLPSQSRHTGDSNAPHVTLLARSRLDDSHDDELRRVFDGLPEPVRLGALVVFGTPPRGLVLARLVVVTTSILRLHSAVHEASPAASDGQAIDAGGILDAGQAIESVHTVPGRWTPHVTLASRLTPVELASALDVLGARDPVGPAGSKFVSARRWDSTLKAITAL